MQMFAQKSGFAIRRFIISLLLLHGVTFLLHVAEILIATGTNSFLFLTLPAAFINDTLFVARIGLLLFPVYLIIYWMSDFTARMFMALVLLIIIIVEIALMQYFIMSKSALGADLWSYSWNDIKLTVKASASISWWQYLLFPVVLGIVLRIHYTMQQYTFSLIVSLGLVATYIMALAVFPFIAISSFKQQSDKILTVNKADYFLSKTQEFYAAKTDYNSLPAYDNSAEYPFVHHQSNEDDLGEYLEHDSTPPNIVMLIIEGLGKTFTGTDAEYGGCMPFLDSLTTKSLYWNNFLSTTGRTFGILPSILGSLPYGPKGFMELGKEMPYHTSLIRLLKNNGYYTGFYYGGDVTFDKQDIFLKEQGIDYMLDATNFGSGYTKIEPNEGGFSWGYPDDALYKRSFEVLRNQKPYLSIYLTVTTHEPFKIPNEKKYDNRIAQFISLSKNQEEIKANKDAFKTLMYADDAIRDFIETYKRRPEYKNTIFIITGDHRMIPVKHKNLLDRYHVPFIVFSPLLKQSRGFKAVSSHNDVPSTLISFLGAQYNLSFPDSVHWLGTGLSFKKDFSSNKRMAIMRNKGDISEYIDGTSFLTDGDLYTVLDNMEMEGNNDEDEKAEVNKLLTSFKHLNLYVCTQNKLYKPYEQKKNTSPVTAKEQMARKSDMDNNNQEHYENHEAINTAGQASREEIKELLTHARNLAKSGNFKHAQITAETIIELDARNKEAYALIIDIELSLNNKKGAQQWYEKAMQYFNKDDFKQELARIKAQ